MIEYHYYYFSIVLQMAQYTRVVISTGGGIVERNSNWGILRHGIVVFLDMKVSLVKHTMLR